MSNPTKPGPPNRLRFAVAAALLFVPALLSLVSAASVSRGRTRVEANVRSLVAMQRLAEGLSRGQLPADDVEVLTRLCLVPENAVAKAASDATDALREKPPVPGQPYETAAVSRVVGALRAANAAESAALGRLIDGLYLSVVFLFLLGAGSLTLFWRLKQSSLKMSLLAGAQLEAARREFADRLATIRTLAAVTAHEINNPLTAVALNLEHLQLRGTFPVELAESVAACVDGTERIRQIVQKLQGLARTDPGEGVELSRVVDSTLSLLVHRVGTTGRVEQRIQAEGRVHADFVGLGQVLSNLVVNALEACDGASTGAVITVDAQEDGPGWIALRVKDNGPGWNPETHSQLLDPFFTTKTSGTGLGLFVCKQIVEGFGGELSLPISEGGAEVKVRLRRLQTLP